MSSLSMFSFTLKFYSETLLANLSPFPVVNSRFRDDIKIATEIRRTGAWNQYNKTFGNIAQGTIVSIVPVDLALHSKFRKYIPTFQVKLYLMRWINFYLPSV